MKYLVLGSSGQVGNALTKFLRNLDNAVLEFDIVRAEREDLRINQNEVLREQMQKADFVFFLAFDVGGSRYLKTYERTYEFIANNAQLMCNTFDMLRETGKPFIFASSQMSNMGFSPYGQLKALGESYTRSLNGVIVKFWNVYGIEHDLTKAHVITDFIIKAQNTKRINMLTDGTEERQFLYADDCSECLHTLAQKYAQIDRAEELHITSFEWVRINEIANIVSEYFPGTLISAAESKDDVQRGKRNDPNPAILNHWSPKTSLKDGIGRIVGYLKQDLTSANAPQK